MNPFNDEYFMKQALVEARAAASEGEVPVGAVIICNNQIIARAHNQTECLNDVTAHAEMLAITAAAGVLGAKYLTNCSLYVTVEPCIMCAGAIGWAQLSTIVYGASDDKRGFSKFAPQAFHPKAIIKKGILEKECAEEMQRFFKQRRYALFNFLVIHIRRCSPLRVLFPLPKKMFLKVRKMEKPIRNTNRIKKKNITNKNLNIIRYLNDSLLSQTQR